MNENLKVQVTLHPFDRVLVRDEDDEKWQADLFTSYDNDNSYICIAAGWNQCIPYNVDTAHLVGTSDPCPIDYDISFSKYHQP